MSEFGGYAPYGTEPLKLTLCLEEGSILFNKAVLDTLDHPKQVQMLINEDRQMLLVQACTVDDREAIVIPAVTKSEFEMSGHSLLKRIRRLTGWADEQPRTVFGTYIASHNAIVFDLMTAQPADLQLPPDGGSGRTS
jgi:hypothetical protein